MLLLELHQLLLLLLGVVLVLLRPDVARADVGALPGEPERVAQAAAALNLAHVVITSVTRDDLADGGASHFAATIHAVRAALPKGVIEVLIPDFQGSAAALNTVLEAKPDILNHNVETVPDLYPQIRPQANFEQSLALLRTTSFMFCFDKPPFVLKSFW